MTVPNVCSFYETRGSKDLYDFAGFRGNGTISLPYEDHVG